MVIIAKNLVCFHVTTSGKQADDLGTDETPIILISLAVFDTNKRESTNIEQYRVKINPELPSCTRLEEGQLLSDECIQETGLSESILDNSFPLTTVLNKIDNYFQILDLNKITLVTDGQSTLRLALHPQIARENIDISSRDYLNHFIDLRKQYRKFYKNEKLSLEEIVKESDNCTFNQRNNYGIIQCQKMIEAVRKMNNAGFNWECVENISKFYISAIVRKTDYVNDEVVVRARGLPWQATDSDISRFFRGLNIEKGGIALVLSKIGRRNGEALIRFECKEHRDLALRKHKHHMGQRYIEVYMATGRDFILVAGGETDEAEKFLKKLIRPSQTLIRMRGLPYTATANQILEFFANNRCCVDGDEEGILFVNHGDGRATGDAFVIFDSEAMAEEALKSHRENIGSRYIELFKSTPAEVNQVMNAVLHPPPASPPQQLPPTTLGPFSYLAGAGASSQFPFFVDEAMSILGAVPIQLSTSTGTLTNPQNSNGSLLSQSGHLQHSIASYLDPNIAHLRIFLRIKGMPLEADVTDIINFLDHFSNYISYQGVHIVYNNLGQPAGEAIIQMISEQWAIAATETKTHHLFNVISGKKSQVELSALSGWDLVHFSGFIHSPNIQTNILPQSSMSINPNAAIALAAFNWQQMLQKSMTNTLNSNNSSSSISFNNLTAFPHCWPYITSQNNTALPQNILASGSNLDPNLQSVDASINLDHHKFSTPTAIPTVGVTYLPGIISLPTTEYSIVVMKNLPKDVNGEEILAIFSPILRQGIMICDIKIGMSQDQTPTGEAFVSFLNRTEAEKSVNECSNQLVRNNVVELSLYY